MINYFISQNKAKAILEAFDPQLPASEINGILEYYVVTKYYLPLFFKEKT